ncbi:MAG TPA: vWA domain-containing protein [Flavipsychrobacter sp.]|nr:vWA domain-containing protein [Flavipsychrobacter sp.]
MHWIFWLIAIILSLAAGYWVYTADRKREVPYPWLTALLRSIVVFLTLLLLLVPTFTITRNEIQKPVILLLQDNSRSISIALGNDSTKYRTDAERLMSELSDKYNVVKWGFGGTVQTDSIFKYRQQTTDIASALSRVQEFFGAQNLGAVILATDGRFNQGVNPLYQQLPLHSSLYSVALGDSVIQKDLRVTQTYSNKVVTLNSQFEIRADIIAMLCNGYSNNIQLKENGEMLSNVPLSINSDRYDRSVSFTIKAQKAGLHHYVISAPEADGEKNITNNHKDVFVEVVDEKKNILIASAAPHPDVDAIKDALSGLESYKITIRTADNFPTSLDDYQVIILHDLPSQNSNVTRELMSVKKPMWFILGSQTNITALSQLQKFATINVNPAATHDVLADYNTAFGIFTLPQNVQAVLDKMPPLSVPIGNIQVTPNANVLFTQKVVGTKTTPLWVLQQGTTPMAMLMGEGLWRWRVYEYKNFNQHNVIDECIRQTVSFLSANSNERPFQAVLPKYVWSDQEPITLNAYLLNHNNEQINTPDAQFTIMDSAGHKQSFSFERSGSAYRLNIGVWAGGNYTYNARVTYEGKSYMVNGSFVVESIPLELMETGADYPLLYGLAKKYNGSLVPSNKIGSLYDSIIHNQNIKPVIQTNTETVPLVDWKWYFFLILLFATAEWLLRKYWLAQ